MNQIPGRESIETAKSIPRSRLDSQRPTWQLPPGVSRGTWDYCTSPDIATEYDQFHASHPLLDFDQRWIAEHIKVRGIESEKTNGSTATLLDLGCGTGRAMLPWYRSGWRTIGYDLSQTMLLETRAKLLTPHADPISKAPASPPGLIHGNLAQLDCLKTHSIDVAICLYSSIGMVRGRENRRDMLRNVFRSLNPGGLFVVHCHNRGMWIREPGGILRVARSYLRSWMDKDWEHGDRIYPYRGLPSMFLHIFTRREMLQDLRAAGFTAIQSLALNDQSSGPLKHPFWLQRWRAGGFLFAATKE